MKNIDHNEARILCHRFLDGATSDAEEEKLYLYFRSGEPADDLAELAPMFEWFDSLPSHSAVSQENKTIPVKKSLMKRIASFSAAAAALLMLTATAITAWQTADTRRDMMELQGSYIIRNGVKVTNIAAIYPELKRAEEIVESTYADIDATDENPLLDAAMQHVSSPEARRAIMESLN